MRSSFPTFKNLAGRVVADRRGSVAVYFAFLAIPAMAMIGAAIDYGRFVDARSRAQSAMDAAVLTAVAQSTSAGANLFLANMTQSGVTLRGTPSFTPNSDGSVTGSASAQMPTTLMSLVGASSMQFAVTSKAALGGKSSSTKTTTANNVCILVLDPTASQSLLINGGFSITAPNCEIDVASTANPAVIFDGSGYNVSHFCVAGSRVIQNGGTITNLTTGCKTAANPYKGKLPAVSNTTCTVSNQNYQGNTSLSPGVYCGNFNFNGSGTLNLAPGLYVFSQCHWNLNSGWALSGTGVTIYFADSNSYIQVNSGADLNLTAPTSGTYANILIYEPDGLSLSQFSINAASGQSLTGLVYLPSRELTFNAGSNLTSESLTMIVDQLILDSNSPGSWTLASGAMTIGSATYSTTTTTTTTTAGGSRILQ